MQPRKGKTKGNNVKLKKNPRVYKINVLVKCTFIFSSLARYQKLFSCLCKKLNLKELPKIVPKFCLIISFVKSSHNAIVP